MISYKEELAAFMAKLNYPANARTVFLGVETRMENEPSYAAAFETWVQKYLGDPAMHIGTAYEALSPLWDEHHENHYTMEFLFNMHCALHLPKMYAAWGWTETMYWDAMLDFSSKLKECMECKNVPGSFVASWFDGWFKGRRFALGRFQYEPHSVFMDPAKKLPCGYVMPQNGEFVAMHIPNTGVPLSDAERNYSYMLADDFFKRIYGDRPVVLRTSTWLLYPKHYEFLPKSSNILKYMDDFQLDNWDVYPVFKDAWRIFGQYVDLPLEEWPEDTSLRRAYKKWLLAGNQAGWGAGLIVLQDGRNITKIPDAYHGPYTKL